MIKITLILFAVFTTYTTNSQVLYNESFDNLTIGNLGTDISGQTAGQGGWYTIGTNGLTNSISEIILEINRGNILKLNFPIGSPNESVIKVFRKDLNNYWQQRNVNNDIFKVSFDLLMSSSSNLNGGYVGSIQSIYSKDGILASFYYSANSVRESITAWLPKRRGISEVDYKILGDDFNQVAYIHTKTLPFNERWINCELFIDYSKNKVYFSIPSMNYISSHNTFFPLSLTDTSETNGDDPVKLEFALINDISPSIQPNIRYDNINIYAVNIAPTLGINIMLGQKFNLYPNPATNVVNITNAENMLVNQVTIYDIAGKQLSTQTYNNETEIQLNVEHLASGTYLLHLQTNEGTAVKKLVKN